MIRRAAYWLLTGVAATAMAATVSFEAIPKDDLKTFAPIALPIIQEQLPHPPIAVDPDTDHAVGFHRQKEVALVMLPQKAVDADAIANAEQPAPIGLVLTRALAVIPRGEQKPVALKRLAAVELNDMFKLPVFYLAARKREDGLALEVYSHDEQPLLIVALKSADAGAPEVDRPTFSIQSNDADAQRARVRFTLPGGYQADVPMGVLPDPN